MTAANNSNRSRSATAGSRATRSVLSGRADGDADGRVPFSRDDLHDDLRRALWATAHHIAVAGPDVSLANAFLDVEAFVSDHGIDVVDPEPPEFPLERFPIAALLDRAYDFAFQVGPRAHRHQDALSDVDFARVRTFQEAAPRSLGIDMITPMADDDSALVRTIDTAYARWTLGGSMSVRDLALLAHMTEPAVRNALSQSKIKLRSFSKDDKNGQVDGAEALEWLQKRRGYVPTLQPDPTDPFYVDNFRRLLVAQGFEASLSQMPFWKSLAEVAQAAEVDPEWLLEVVTGRPAPIDIPALTRVARTIDAIAPAFVARCVEMTMRAIEPPRPTLEDTPLGRRLAEATAQLAEFEKHETNPIVDGPEET